MSFHDRIRATTLRVFRKRGTLVTLGRRVSGAYNPATSAVSSASSSAVMAHAIFGTANERVFGGGLVREGDAMADIAAAEIDGVEPKAGDTITRSGVIWTVVATSFIDSGQGVVLWRLLLRR